jgi:hypothetical protein
MPRRSVPPRWTNLPIAPSGEKWVTPNDGFATGCLLERGQHVDRDRRWVWLGDVFIKSA